jgi:hypothetical protein
MYLFIYFLFSFFFFKKILVFLINNCLALPCFELVLLEDNSQENNGLPCPALFRIGAAKR